VISGRRLKLTDFAGYKFFNISRFYNHKFPEAKEAHYDEQESDQNEKR
jgi:hypothetical protein